jgi:BirA family biotin operon repressor/biotin-[acetyl-CoA-carboxylase] ligase
MTKDQGLQTTDYGPRTNAFVDVARLCTETFVRHAEFFDTIGSTNDRSLELAARADLPTPALVVARLQTAGRGRGKNTWWADDGALTFSLLLDTARWALTPRDWPRLSLAAGVAVCDALGGTGTDSRSSLLAPGSSIGIRWPNDVLIDGRKVCGILIESPGGAPPAKDRLIVGIGINVNNSWQHAPPDAGPAGTALCDVTGRPHDLQDVLLRVILALANRLAQLVNGDQQLPQAWQQLDLLRGRTVSVESNGHQAEGTCVEVAEDGALILETLNGRQSIYSGVVAANNS